MAQPRGPERSSIAILLGILLASVAVAPRTSASTAWDAMVPLLAAGRYPEAAASARASLRQARAHPGRDSLALADAIDAYVEAVSFPAETIDSEWRTLAEQALRIRERAQPADHRDIAQTLLELARLDRYEQDYAAARPRTLRALAIRERADGPESPNVAHALTAYGDLLDAVGEYAASKRTYERSLAILERARGRDDPDVAQVLNNLAILLRDTGEYDAARADFERALEIRRKALPADHPDLAESINNLGNLVQETADYEAALQLQQDALRRWEQALPADHPNLAAGCNNLATLLREMGDYPEARRLYERAIRIWEISRPGSSDLAGGIANYATLLSAAGDSAGARVQFKRAVAVAESASGAVSPDVASSLLGLAGVLDQSGDHAESRATYERALAILEEMLGPDHPVVSSVRIGLAQPALAMGDTAAAVAAYERAVASESLMLGSGHPKLAEALVALAGLRAAMGETRAALDTALLAEHIGREHLRLTIRTLPERQALRYRAVRASGLNLALSIAERSGSPDDAARVWDTLVRSRTLVLDEMATRRRTLHASRDTGLVQLRAACASATSRLAHLLVRDPANELLEQTALLDSARREVEQLERQLAQGSTDARANEDGARLGLDAVLAALPPGAALVAYVRYERVAPAGGAGPSSPAARYLAFVRPSGGGRPVVVPLGSADSIERAVTAWRDAAGGGDDEAAETAYRTVGADLRRRVWDPVGAALGGASRVFIVPDGALQLVSFATLPVGRREYLIERGPLLHGLSAERDLLPREPAAGRPPSLLAVGDVDFERAEVPPRPRSDSASLAARAAAAEDAAAFRGATTRCADFASLRFTPLPSTGVESREVIALWEQAAGPSAGVVALTGAEAGESALKTVAPSQTILHLATHGFFLGERCPAAFTTGLGSAGAEADARAARVGENPLVLSGLALSGANARDRAEHGQDDGVLTAEEIATLDLSGVDWAVLSACDTGLGSLVSGEGVFGLRRAFQIAGARTVLMSLWPVGDVPTRRWMKALYTARLTHGLGTAESVRAASLEALRRRRQHRESTHPASWGAFIATGDWR